VRIPVWVPLLFAVFVIGFGSYRIWLGLRTAPAPDEPAPGAPAPPPSRSVFAGSFSRMGKRTHLFIGIIYLILGVCLIGVAFGYNPLGSAFGSSASEPDKDQAPARDGVRIETAPKP
jgi:hypothetical protein